MICPVLCQMDLYAITVVTEEQGKETATLGFAVKTLG